jgi:hypothetical protein
MSSNGSNGNQADEVGETRVQEMIGRYTYTTVQHSLWTGGTIDETKTNYQFWDKLRRGQMDGYSLGGLFAKPISDRFTARVLGKGIEMKLAGNAPGAGGETQSVMLGGIGDSEKTEESAFDYTNDQLRAWMQRIHAQIIQVVGDMYGLGDQYIVVNPDGSLSVPSPDMVEPEWDPLDYRKKIKYTITSRLPKVQVKDIYTATERVLEIKNTFHEDVVLGDGIVIKPDQTVLRTFANLIGRIPIVHFPNERSANELFGRPIYESLLTLFSQYDDLIFKALKGAKLMGCPIPTIEGVEDFDETIAQNSRDVDETYQDVDGVEVERTQLVFDEESVMLVGPGGRFHFAAPPGGFTSDVRSMLKVLFLLMLEYCGIPEAVWGGEMGQARSTSVEQMRDFNAAIERRRIELERAGEDAEGDIPQDGLLALADIWLRMRRLTDPKIKVAPVEIVWPELTLQDEKMVLEKTRFALEQTLVRKVKALELLRMAGIEKPGDEVAMAIKEAEEWMDKFDQAVNKDLASTEADVGAVDMSDNPNQDFYPSKAEAAQA